MNTNELCYLAELARKDTDRRLQAFHGVFDPQRLSNDLLEIAKLAESQDLVATHVAIFNTRVSSHDWTKQPPAPDAKELGR